MAGRIKDTNQLLEAILETMQDVFILQALESGITAENARTIVGVDKGRVNRISRVRKKPAKN